MAEKQFTKIAFNPTTEVVTLEHQENRTDGEANKFVAEMREPPHEDFLRAFKKLAGHVITLCELKGIDPSEVEVRSVTLRHKDDRLGATITGVRKLEKSNSPLVLHTPLKWTPQGAENEDTSLCLSDFAAECLDKLAAEAENYLAGTKRGPARQTDLLKDTGAKGGDEDEEEVRQEGERVEQGELVGAEA